MKFMIDFMVEIAKSIKMEEQAKEEQARKFPQRKRTPREVLGTLRLAAAESSQFPHHRYVDDHDVTPRQRDADDVTSRQRNLTYERSLKKPMPVNEDQNAASEKKPRLDLFDPEEIEHKCNKGIVIRDQAEIEPEKKKRIIKKKRKYSDDDDEFNCKEEKKKRKSSNKKDRLAVANLPEPELPENLRARIREVAKGDENFDENSIVCVIQKDLQESDTIRQQNRLAMPKKQIRAEFLTETEEVILSDKPGPHTKPIEVPIIELPGEVTGETRQLTLRKWHVGKKSVSYVLNGDWMGVVARNKLHVGQIVQVWAFRVSGKLNIAFVFPEIKVKKEEEASTSSQETLAAPPLLLLTQGEAETTTTAETAGSSGSGSGSGSDESNVRSGGLNFDLNMEPDGFLD